MKQDGGGGLEEGKRCGNALVLRLWASVVIFLGSNDALRKKSISGE